MLLAAAALTAPAGIAVAAAQAPAPAPVTVARYSFDSGFGAGGTVADLSGRGMPLRVRAADGGAVRFIPRGTGRAVALPARCAATATRCPRAILEGGDDVDLDPGTRAFRFGTWAFATPAQVGTGANLMQKGVATTESQWKLQIGQQGRAHCVLVGRGSTRVYIVRSTVKVNDGRWHQLTCRRTPTALAIFVDGTARGVVSVPAAVTVANGMPLRLGGQNLSTRSDQFGGALDEVFVSLG